MEKRFSSSTKTKRSFYRRKLQYQERIIEQSTSSLPTASMLEPNYLTTKVIGNICSKIASNNAEDIRIVQVDRKRTDDKLSCVFMFFLKIRLCSFSLFPFFFFVSYYTIETAFEK